MVSIGQEEHYHLGLVHVAGSAFCHSARFMVAVEAQQTSGAWTDDRTAKETKNLQKLQD